MATSVARSGASIRLSAPVVLLTGEYDYSCPPEDTYEVAERVGQATVEVMQGLGHFPMSEDPDRFLEYLRPTLARLRAAGTAR